MRVVAQCSFLLVFLAACGSSFRYLPPPELPSVPQGVPVFPTAHPGTPPPPLAPSIHVVVHKSHDVPDLRGKLVALPLMASDPLGSAFERAFTLQLVDKGVTRLLPGAALASIAATLDRPESGSGNGHVKLTAQLADLSLVSDASGADFVIYGEINVTVSGSTVQVPYEIDKAALDRYARAYAPWAKALARSAEETNVRCDGGAQRGRLQRALRLGGPPSALRTQIAYGRFSQQCLGQLARLSALQREALPPARLVAEAHKRTSTLEHPETTLHAVVRVRDDKTGETFWIGIFDAKAPDTRRATNELARAVLGKLSATWGTATPVAPGGTGQRH